MQQDKNVNYRKRDDSALADFGEKSPTNSFSGGETDHLFISHEGQQFYDLDRLSGLDDPGDGRTACFLDYDRDGWIDVVTASANAPTFQLFRNHLGENQRRDLAGAGMVAVRLVGGNATATPSKEWSNRDGIGTRITVRAEGPPLLREARCGEGRAGQNSTTMIVGVGAVDVIGSIDVRWPSGKTETVANVPVGHVVTFFENPLDSPTGSATTVEPYLLEVLANHVNVASEGLSLPMTLPTNEGGPRLNLVTAMTTHCASCKAKQPQVKLLRDTFPADEVGIWGVDTDLSETSADLVKYEKEHEVYYDVLPDIPMADRERLRQHVMDTFHDDVTPVTVITDSTGHVLGTYAGIPSVSDVQKLLSK